MAATSIKIPASTANVGPGYDVLGIALSLYNTITIEESDTTEVIITGAKSDNSLPADKNNLVYQAIETFYNNLNRKCPDFKITIDCQIPLASGLGSSSTAIAGGLAIANKFENEPFDTDTLLKLAWKLEGHPDNVAPAILGGFVISAITEENDLVYKKLLWPEEWQIIICHPDFKLSTKEARAILPAEIPLKDAIFNISCSSFLISAVCTKDEKALKLALKDKLHQPYRSKLVPGLTQIFEDLEKYNILGAVISGAGPSICIINKNEDPSIISNAVKTIWNRKNIDCEFFFPKVENNGIIYL
ncbi:MAG: homoserine kinase [Cyanobacteriota bacterium]